MENPNFTTENESHSALEQAVKRHFEHSKLPKFDDYLFQNIVNKLAYEKDLKALKPRLWAALATFVSSLALLVFAFVFSAHAFAQTAISKYFSLVFTDFGQVVINWKEFSYSILESLPLGALSLLLGSFLAAAALLDFGTHQFSNFRKLSHHRYQAR